MKDFLLDAGMSLYSLGMFRQYLSSAIQVIPVGFSSFSEVSDKMVISEHKRLSQMGYFDCSDSIEHLGRRGKENGFLGIFLSIEQAILIGLEVNIPRKSGKVLLSKVAK